MPDLNIFPGDVLVQGRLIPATISYPAGGLTNDADGFGYRRRTDAKVMTSSLRTAHTSESRARFASAAPGSVETAAVMMSAAVAARLRPRRSARAWTRSWVAGETRVVRTREGIGGLSGVGAGCIGPRRL